MYEGVGLAAQQSTRSIDSRHGRNAGYRPIGRRTPCINICPWPLPGTVAEILFERRITGRDDRCQALAVLTKRLARGAEINQQRAATLTQEQVPWIDVAMNKVQRVQRLERERQLRREEAHFVGRKAARPRRGRREQVGLVDPALQRAAAEERHHEHGPRPGVEGVAQRAQVRGALARRGGEQLALEGEVLLEASDGGWLAAGTAGVEQLEREDEQEDLAGVAAAVGNVAVDEVDRAAALGGQALPAEIVVVKLPVSYVYSSLVIDAWFVRGVQWSPRQATPWFERFANRDSPTLPPA